MTNLTPRLKRREFGDPILRQTAKRLSLLEIKNSNTKQLIKNMQTTLDSKKYGIGLAAPQVGRSLAIGVIAIKPTPARPDALIFVLVVINPEIIKTYGNKKPMWEGCISGSRLFAKVPRWRKIRLKYFDEKAKILEADFDGLIAHVLQHEIDHLNGILFVDRVKDSTSYCTFSEYKKQMEKRI